MPHLSAVDALLLGGLLTFAWGEALALVNGTPGDTASERLRAWVRRAPWRRAALAGALVLFYLHVVYAWPL